MPTVLEQPTNVFKPVTGESQADFIDRVWDAVPGDTDIDRARFCRDAWFSCRDGNLMRIAERQFPPDQYRQITGSAVFKEHSTQRQFVDPQTRRVRKEPVIYDRAAIASIADRCNERIVATSDFSPLTEGHTPTKDMLARGAKQPEVLGYAGPYYLGKLAGQFAIFCDEHHLLEDEPRLAKLQRRSPEVWLEDRMEDRFFDPIACLGAETPRLDLGMTRYGRFFEAVGEDGSQLMKYAAPAASPSGSNTFVPNTKDAYQAEDDSMLAPEDIQSILQAISETAPFQAMAQLAPHIDKLVALAGGNTPAPATAPAASAPTASPSPVSSPSGPAAPIPEHKPAPQKYQADDEDHAMIQKYMSGECDDAAFSSHMAARKSKYAAASVVPASTPAVPAPTENYSKSRERVEAARYARENEELRRMNAELLAENRQKTRYSALQSKRDEGYILDLDEELADTADLTDEQFERHLNRIDRYERVPLGTVVPPLPAPDLERTATAKERYSRERKEWIVSQSMTRGLTYDAAAAEWDATHKAP